MGERGVGFFRGPFGQCCNAGQGMGIVLNLGHKNFIKEK